MLMVHKYLFVSFVAMLMLTQFGCTPQKTEAPKNNFGVNNVVRCDGGEDVSSFGIIGGKTLSAQSRLAKGVVFLVTSYYHKVTKEVLGAGACTGALIDSNIILTAAHCFGKFEAEGVDSADVDFFVTAFSGYRPVCEVRQKDYRGLKADKVLVHSDYSEEARTGDIALVRLQDSMPGSHTYYQLDAETHDFSLDEKMVAVGYGKSVSLKAREESDRPLKFGFLSSNKSSNFQSIIVSYFSRLEEALWSAKSEEIIETARKKALEKNEPFDEAAFKVALRNQLKAMIQAMKPVFDYSTANENLVFDQSRGESVCSGDSGGPGLRRAGDTLKIVGVAQAVFSSVDGIDQCQFGSFYTNVSYHKDWIISSFNALKNSDNQVHNDGAELFR
jgi:secreted trypsin-like serine protease